MRRCPSRIRASSGPALVVLTSIASRIHLAGLGLAAFFAALEFLMAQAPAFLMAQAPAAPQGGDQATIQDEYAKYMLKFAPESIKRLGFKGIKRPHKIVMPGIIPGEVGEKQLLALRKQGWKYLFELPQGFDHDMAIAFSTYVLPPSFYLFAHAPAPRTTTEAVDWHWTDPTEEFAWLTYFRTDKAEELLRKKSIGPILTTTYFRTNNWEELERLRQEGKKRWINVGVEYKQRDVLWVIASINARGIQSPEDLGFRALTPADAARLQDRLNAALRMENAFELPAIERRILGTTTENAEQFRACPEWKKRRLERYIAGTRAASYKVTIKSYGADSYVISTRKPVEELGDTDSPVHPEPWVAQAASLCNGVLFAEIELVGTMPEEEIGRDMEFFLQSMHENTLWGR